MSRRRIQYALAFLLAVALIKLVLLGVAQLEKRACAKRLSALVFAVAKAYPMDHRGLLPSNLSCVVGEYVAGGKIFVCPGAHRIAGNPAQEDKWTDYGYIYWRQGSGYVQDTYPVLFDRSLSNHGGKGLNVAYLDGSVRWDRGGQLLLRFAHDHPEADIRLPEGLRAESKGESAPGVPSPDELDQWKR